jgi:hypothetical protein
MAITDTATHAPLIDGEDLTTAGTRVRSSANDNEAFAFANDTRSGLAGTVWVDEHLAAGSPMPRGGVRDSGFGKDMTMYALEECTARHDAVSPR